MYRLTLFGGVLLSGPGGRVRGPASQQKRLALLALVVTAGKRGISRDRIVALLWPDSGIRESRHRLSHSLYVLRRTLGKRVFDTTMEFVRSDPRQLTSDLCDFETALERGDREAAFAAYSGPFMDGFFLGSSSEFDHWVEGERRRLSGMYEELIQTLAHEADADGDPEIAAGWWRRLVNHDPYNSAAVIGLMTALVAAGEPANALQAARQHFELLRTEFSMDPPAEVQSLVRHLVRPAG